LFTIGGYSGFPTLGSAVGDDGPEQREESWMSLESRQDGGIDSLVGQIQSCKKAACMMVTAIAADDKELGSTFANSHAVQRRSDDRKGEIPHALIEDTLSRLRCLRDDSERFQALEQYRSLRSLLAERLLKKEIASHRTKSKIEHKSSGAASSSSSVTPHNESIHEGTLEDSLGWRDDDYRFCSAGHHPQVILQFKNRRCITWKCYLCKIITAQRWLPGSEKCDCDRIVKHVHNTIRTTAKPTQMSVDDHDWFEASDMIPIGWTLKSKEIKSEELVPPPPISIAGKEAQNSPHE
jgi:hypothetical protein